MKKLILIAIPFFLVACGGSSPVSVDDDEQLGSLPQNVIHPDDNPTSQQKVALGKLLFWDPVLSGNQDVACVTCHHPDHGYAENIDLSIGVGGHGLSENRIGGLLIKRNAPTIINTAFNGLEDDEEYDPIDAVMFWDNRTESLEAQALEPIKSAEEMRGDFFTEEEIIEEVVGRLTNIPEYLTLFEQAFGSSEINGDRIAKAIAAFERSIVSFNSPFDRYARGDDSALTQQQIRGLNAFIDSGCSGCHSGPMFSDFELHELPVDSNRKLQEAGIVDEGENRKFRTPSLRNVALTAPYMHNGTEATLIDAIEFYDDIENPSNDPELSELEFDEVEDETIDAIAAFLRALTDESFDKTIPARVPSGLNPGGNI